VPREVGSHEGLGPLLAEADMDALAAVAEQAGLQGIDLHALARVLDAAQRIAVAAERVGCTKLRTVADQVLRDMQAQGVLPEWQTLLEEALRA
jgi:hypothetical protein